VIPSANVEHLMLRADVVEAVGGNRFHVYAVAHVDEALELLTGVPAGAPGATGSWPPDSVNGRVARRLAAFATPRQTAVVVERRGRGARPRGRR
jgi:predicted ATP-dependent protease